MTEPSDVIDFWREAGRERWFKRDDAFDQEVTRRFRAAWDRAAAGDLDGWTATADGSLALVLLLDQMPRNMFRGDVRTWSTDALGLAAAERAIAAKHDEAVDPVLRPFLYLPFMHAEDGAAQDRAVRFMDLHGDPDNRRFARHHRDIIARFGRFPHRNAVLGRKSTPEEVAFLEEDGFRG